VAFGSTMLVKINVAWTAEIADSFAHDWFGCAVGNIVSKVVVVRLIPCKLSLSSCVVSLIRL